MKKPTVSALHKKVWEHCKRLVRAKYIRPSGQWICFTCDRLLDEPAKAQTGHFIPSGACGAYLRCDLRNLRIQCYHCNINLGGNGAEYYRRMVREVGQAQVDQLFKDKNKIVNAFHHYAQLLATYENL